MSGDRTVKDLVDRVRQRCAFLNPKNPERVLFEECVQALVDVSVQLAQAKAMNDHFEGLKARSADNPYGIPKVQIRRVEEPNGEEEATDPTTTA